MQAASSSTTAAVAIIVSFYDPLAKPPHKNGNPFNRHFFIYDIEMKQKDPPRPARPTQQRFRAPSGLGLIAPRLLKKRKNNLPEQHST